MNVKKTTVRLTVMAMLIGLEIVLSRFLSIPTSITKIGFAFIPVAAAALLLGPLAAGAVGALGDLLGALLFPIGAYFPGFTLTAACTGLIFGLCLYKKPLRWLYPAAAAVLNVVLVSYLANTAMICYITGNAFSVMLAARAVQLAVMLPVQFLVLSWLHHSALVKQLL